MEFPKKKVEAKSNYITIDTKKCGIWDLINLGNQGGVLPLSGQYFIECIKDSQKWCTLYLMQSGIGVQRPDQQFVAKKVVRDKEVESQLKKENRELSELVKDMEKRIAALQGELAQFQSQLKGNTQVSDEVLEL